MELNLIWDCLYGEIIESVTNGHSMHVSRLLSVLVLIVENGFMKKISGAVQFALWFYLVLFYCFFAVLTLFSEATPFYRADYQPMFKLVRLLVQTYVPPVTEEGGKQATDIVIKSLQLSLFIVDGLHKANDLSALSHFSCQLVPIFSLKNPG